MLSISKSVGEDGVNQKQDVLTIQKALNKIKPPLGTRPLKEDGLYGKKHRRCYCWFSEEACHAIQTGWSN